MTAKEVYKKLSQEKFDKKNLPLYVVVGGERYEVVSVDLYDDAVHLAAGEDVPVIDGADESH